MEIKYLADATEVIPTLAVAFLQDGFAHPAEQSVGAVAAGLRVSCQRDGLPLALVALDGGAVLGTVALRWDSIASRPELGPWVAALYVVANFRGRGVGAQLVRAAELEARRLSLGAIYTGTSTAGSVFQRLGWTEIERLTYCGQPVVIYRRELAPAS